MSDDARQTALRSSLWPRSSLLARLTASDREELLGLGTRATYPSQQALIRHGDPEDYAVLLTKGFTKVAQALSATEVSRAISNAVRAKRTTQQGETGLLDEWNALGQLSAKSTFVSYAHWLLRFLLIALDSLPITAKMMSGSTAYDRLLTSEIESAERISDIDVQFARAVRDRR
jgi:hypothetical protein